MDQGLRSPDERERDTAIECAKRLAMPLRDYLLRQIEQRPNDSSLWFHLVFGADAETVAHAVSLAERVLDLEAYASGPALDLFGPPEEEGPHQALDFVLQELPRFPGLGGRLLRAALESPVVRQRLVALRALSRWPRDLLGEDLLEAVERSRRHDPDERVRSDAAAVARGEAISDPWLEDDLDDE